MARIKNELLGFQSIPRNLIFDSSVSDRARFVYCFMASKPDDWDFFLEPMAKEIGYSVDTLRKYINELINKGWLVKGEQQNTMPQVQQQYVMLVTVLRILLVIDFGNIRISKNGR